jgi:uncharacterized protein YkwD
LYWIPQIGYRATSAAEWSRAKETSKKTKDQVAVDVWGESSGHDKNQKKDHSYQIDGIPAKCLGEWP